MSDFGRKGFSTQAEEKITPQSQKSTAQVAGENLTGAADKVFGSAQPNESKSTSQKFGDATRSNADEGQNQGSSAFNSAKEGLNNVYNSVTGQAKDATK
ncbi:putative 12 kDa heat shock protein [Amylocarpus encephaloides]|uniref:12 kDa heat shock protein n=1 Tax=Amylocarpus encephaloides TaxID=45428 RepID=A0A9P8C5B1_9HELO|nr:putative 12 kDa heat shock protein [Amylocarpus encephaloides]